MTFRKITAACIIVIIVSFLGFWVENTWLSIYLGFMDNRNMHLPFLLGYGLGVIAIYAAFGTPKALRVFCVPIKVKSAALRTVIYWLFACAGVMLGEIALGTFVEKVFDIIWWEYTTLPLHITKYTSVPTTAAFGALITFFMGTWFTPVYSYFIRRQNKAVAVVACIVMVLLVADLSVSALQMYETADFVEVWRWDVPWTPLYKLLGVTPA